MDSKLLFFLTVWIGLGAAVPAAEIRLTAEHRADSPLVTLADLAHLDGEPEEIEALGRIAFFPAPAAGTVRVVRPGEVRELLILHGLDPTRHRIVGARSVKVYPESPSASRSEDASRSEAAGPRQAAQIGSVSEKAAPPPGSPVQLAQALVAGQPGPPAVEEPLPELVVVAVRPLRRGEKLGRGDVRLQPAPQTPAGVQLVQRLEDAVGQQTNRSIATGQPIDARAIQSPLLVRRNEVVTVYARAAGVQVRTHARALDSGSRGELVTLESLDNRQRYSARVIGIQEVEVYARGAAVPSDETSN